MAFNIGTETGLRSILSTSYRLANVIAELSLLVWSSLLPLRQEGGLRT